MKTMLTKQNERVYVSDYDLIPEKYRKPGNVIHGSNNGWDTIEENENGELFYSWSCAMTGRSGITKVDRKNSCYEFCYCIETPKIEKFIITSDEVVKKKKILEEAGFKIQNLPLHVIVSYGPDGRGREIECVVYKHIPLEIEKIIGKFSVEYVSGTGFQDSSYHRLPEVNKIFMQFF